MSWLGFELLNSRGTAGRAQCDALAFPIEKINAFSAESEAFSALKGLIFTCYFFSTKSETLST